MNIDHAHKHYMITLADSVVSFNRNKTETCQKVVGFRCIRSDGSMNKRRVSASENRRYRHVYATEKHVSVMIPSARFRPVKRGGKRVLFKPLKRGNCVKRSLIDFRKINVP